MTKFSPSESALQGFRITRAHPVLIFVWSLFLFGALMLAFAVVLMGIGPEFVSFVKHGGLQSIDVGNYARILQNSWLPFILFLVLGLLVWSTLIAAIYRSILRPEDSKFAYLRFGGDEIRLTIVNLALIPFGIISAAVVAAIEGAIGGLTGIICSFALSAILIWIGVRLALATPMTFAERRIAIFASWRLTRNHFWPLAGMLVLASIFWLMVWLVCFIISLAAVTIAGGQEMLDHPTTASPVSIITLLVSLLVQLVLPTLYWVMLASPLAEAYRELRDETAETAASLRSEPAPT